MNRGHTEAESQLQVVVFTLEGKSLAVDILRVQEIFRMVEITPFPKMPPFALGVINLRGQIVPIINLRSKLLLLDRPPSAKTCIILVRTSGQILGFLTDDVAEVLSLPPESIERSEGGQDWMRSDIFAGVGKLPGRLIVIINTDRLLSPKEEKQLRKSSPDSHPQQKGAK